MSSILRWLLRLGGGLVALLIGLASVLYVLGSQAVNRTYEPTVQPVALSTDSATLAHGEHLSRVLGCYDCHGDRLQGTVMDNAPPVRVAAPNITPAGVVADYSTKDWFRALRHGLDPNGRALVSMPSSAFNHLSDADAAALIAYLKSVEPVEREVPPTTVKPVGRVLTGLGAFDPAAEVRLGLERPRTVPRDNTIAFGRYLTSIACQHCHGPSLHGQPSPNPSAPYAPSLAGAGTWTFETFETLMRTGVTPAGDTLNPKHMPWSAFRHHTDVELRALHEYIGTLSTSDSEPSAGR